MVIYVIPEAMLVGKQRHQYDDQSPPSFPGKVCCWRDTDNVERRQLYWPKQEQHRAAIPDVTCHNGFEYND